MRMYIRLALLFVAASFIAVSAASAQDLRFKDYPVALKMPTAGPDLAVCRAQEYYTPADIHLLRYADTLHATKKEAIDRDYCVVMTTTSGPRSVMLRAGTIVGKDAAGHFLFDATCGNPIFSEIAMPQVQQVAAVTPATVLVPALAPPPAIRRFEPLPPLSRSAQPEEPAPLPPPAPIAVAPVATAKRPEENGKKFTLSTGVGFMGGSVNSTYEEAIPTTGDVPQRHNFVAPVFTARVEQHNNGDGLFGSFMTTFLGSVDGIQFQDATGTWVTKKRDSDSSRDKFLNVTAGYQHTLGPYLAIGGFGGYNRLCLCESYVAQGATTVTERSYQGLILGIQAVGSTTSNNHRIRIAVKGEFGPSLTRKSWTQQTYPGVNFPLVSNPNEKAQSFAFEINGDVPVYKAFHVNLGWEYTGYSSTRPPPSFEAHEDVRINAPSLGVSLHWGK